MKSYRTLRSTHATLIHRPLGVVITRAIIKLCNPSDSIQLLENQGCKKIKAPPEGGAS